MTSLSPYVIILSGVNDWATLGRTFHVS